MSTPRDLTGQRFGRLVALSPTDQRVGGSVIWKCQCDCGNIAYVRRNSLVDHHTSSCGCLRKEATAKRSMANARNLTGMRIGSLVAVRPTDKRKKRTVVWECKCDCGNTVYASSSELISGSVTSCGCTK